MMVQEGRMSESPGGAPPGAAADLRRDVDAIKSDLAALREDLASIVNSAVQAGKAQAGDARERLSDMARSRLEQVGSTWEDANLRGREILDQVQHQIEDRPLQAVGIAFAAGLVLGALARR
jgi:ElaB/YqjD/DUF883 family membrane-anchored ribosome-binding protein